MTNNLPSWLEIGDYAEDAALEGIGTLPYETYVEIERDIRTVPVLGHTVAAVMTFATLPVPKDADPEVFNSMRAAKIAQLIVNYGAGIYDRKEP